MWFIFLVGLVGQGLATQVNYQTLSSGHSSSASSSEQQWSWQEDQAAAPSNQDESFHPVSFSASDAVPSYQVEQEKHQVYEVGSSNPNDAADFSSQQPGDQHVETVIEDILVSNRQGRNLDGYDEVYSDPNVKNALQQGNDTVARSYIRDKLCSLGLMRCDDVEGRRPYYSPHRDIHPQEVIYAQPVTIKPVGHPLPAIPVKRPYGPPKPNPFQPGFGAGPIYSKPGFGPRPQPFVGPYPAYKKPGFIPGPKPVYEAGIESDIDYEDKFIDKKQVVVSQGAGVQQHVHHHYVHGDGIGDKGPIILGGTAGVSSGNNYGYGNSGTYGNSFNNFEDYKKTFNTKGPSSGNNLLGAASNNYADKYPVYERPKPNSLHDGQKNFESTKVLNSGYSNNGFVNNNNNFGANSFGGNGLGSHGPNGLGGNGLGLNGLGANGLGANGLGANGLGANGFGSNGLGSNGFGSNNFETGNGFDAGFGTNNYDNCVCVPFDQCSTLNQAGRKDDLYLAIDPRSLGKDIEAESIIAIDGNSTSVIRIAKGVNATEQAEQTKELKEESADSKEKKERTKRDTKKADVPSDKTPEAQSRQFGRPPACGPRQVCCRRANIIGRPSGRLGQCGTRNSQGINGRIKNPVYVDGDSEFGEYPWQVAILKKDPSESVYVCGGTLISSRHILTAAHCVKTHAGRDLRARLGEWDVNHDVEFFPYIERDVVSVYVHPEFYAGTLYNDLAILKLDHDINFEKNPHISPACLPEKFEDFTGNRCWTTGWGKDAFGDYGKYQNILKEVDVPVISNPICENQMRRTRLGPSFNLHPGFICAGGEEGKDACKGDGGGPMVCEKHGKWQLAGVVSWGIGCGQAGVPGVYSRVSYYLDWINQVVNQF